ncbi:MAG TPA: hypoxanthine phosphoribosyltransferase [Desulfomonilia bacterium]|nr:hypoxanthine phosphoribosyltransferase [Desulfomonilia bacterium]
MSMPFIGIKQVNTTLTPLPRYVIDPTMKVLYTALEIAEKVNELADKISSEYQGHELFIVGILKGGFMFMSDLVRRINLPMRIDFARLSSYGNADRPLGEVTIVDDIHEAVAGKHVLIVDDIMDTGHSLLAFKNHLMEKGPVSVKICTMIDKSERREASISPDYYGFHITDGFVVGYGLDYAENYRSLPQLYLLDPEDRRDIS